MCPTEGSIDITLNTTNGRIKQNIDDKRRAMSSYKDHTCPTSFYIDGSGNKSLHIGEVPEWLNGAPC
tara:strand:- start:98 stop:298 length:201 start_codon:yes stop_codon:yes gene_type:complete